MMSNVKMAGLEKIWPKRDLACLKQAATASVGILALADAATRNAPPTVPLALVQTMQEMAAIFEAGDYPTDIAPPSTTESHPLFADMAALLAIFTTPQPESTPSKKEGGGFFSPDAFTNPDHVRFAVKGTAAVMTSYFIFKILDWPGIHTCIITCFIVALPTMGEMIAKLTLRISGALIGGAIGIAAIIFLMPHLQEITAFLVLVFVVSLIAAWVKTGDERIAYAGLQIGLAFFLTDLKGYGPTTDMATARDRIVGIMLGNFITYAVFTSFWPASSYDKIASTLRNVAKSLTAQRDSASIGEKLACAAAVQSAISTSEHTVEYAAAEPIHLRADMKHLAAYHAALQDAAQLTEDLLTAGHDVHADRTITQLEKFAS